jgi:hypothetical protein
LIGVEPILKVLQHNKKYKVVHILADFPCLDIVAKKFGNLAVYRPFPGGD